MSAAKHTPGPWNIDIVEDILHNTAEWDNTDEATLAADARLIAKAPEMRETVSGLLDSLAEWQLQYDPDHTDEVTATRIDHARALLACIDGEEA